MRNKNQFLKTPDEKTLTLLIGIPGVGKSVLANKLIKKDSVNRIIISSDNVRFDLLDYDETGIDHDSNIEPKVWGIIKNQIKEALLNPNIKECIMDSTNIRTSGREKFIQMAKDLGIKTRGIVLYASFMETKNRNRNREREVPESIIDTFYKKFQHPKKEEFDELFHIGSKRKFEKWTKIEKF